MDTITIKVSDLEAMVKELVKDKMDFVKLSLLEADEEIPATVNFTAFQKDGLYEVDFDYIEAVE